MKKSEMVETAIKACKFSSVAIEKCRNFLTVDRFENGIQALDNWIEVGGIFHRIKISKAFKRTEIVEAFNAVMDMPVDIPKGERACAETLYLADKDHLRNWYIDQQKFAVSPRTILKEYGKYQESLYTDKKDAEGSPDADKAEESEKSDFQKITESLQQARKLLEKGGFSAEEYRLINGFAAGIATIANQATELKVG